MCKKKKWFCIPLEVGRHYEMWIWALFESSFLWPNSLMEPTKLRNFNYSSINRTRIS